MEIVLRTAGIYLVLLSFFRLMGKRSLSQLSMFDFIVFLIISEAVQNALVDDDKSVVMGLTVVLTFLMLDLGLSLLKARFGGFDRLADGVPVVLVEQGRPIEANLLRTRITPEDILQTARQTQGLQRMEQVRYAVLETNGSISIIPQQSPEQTLLNERLEALLRRLDEDPGVTRRAAAPPATGWPDR